MKRKNKIILLGIITFLFLSGCAEMDNDVQLARRIFNGLCNNRQGVEELIDWNTLKAVGVDVGQTYSNIRSEKEKTDYRKIFFYNFAFAFKSAGGRTSQFFDWRVKSQDANSTVVAADTAGQGKIILFTITHKDGKRKLTAIDWVK